MPSPGFHLWMERLQSSRAHDVNYLDFFTKVVERLEAGAKQVGVLNEEESRDLLTHALTRVFGNRLRADPHIDFKATMALILEVIHIAWGKRRETMST
ncbi:hypothetical protein D1007_51428 [Hordeum vulgare]|nr:hypothetical protein D1007_51428 [Hordeum vulgare]